MLRHGFSLAAVCLWLSACSDFIKDPSLDSWCGEELCHFSTDAGEIERVGTWHVKDYAVRFLEQGTQISQLSEQSGAECIAFSVIANVDRQANMVMEVDFNDDGKVDLSHPIPQARWEPIGFEVAPPVDYDSMRFILRKNGKGEAVVAQVRATRAERCGTEPLVLAEGSRCASNESCESGRCVDQTCIACPNGGCAAETPCVHDNTCASRACLFEEPADENQDAWLDRARFEAGQLDLHRRVCGECESSADCETGVCHEGRCAACSDDSQCDDGLRCGYRDAFDLSSRACLSEQPTQRPRGALCERDEECEAGLGCASHAPGLLARCGEACIPGDASGCPAEHVCAVPGLDFTAMEWGARWLDGLVRDLTGADPRELETTEAWSAPGGRVSTCYPQALDGEACTLHAQCDPGACCNGRCQAETTPDGACPAEDS